jgi:hypothetical protein
MAPSIQGRYLAAAVGLVCDDHPERYCPARALNIVMSYVQKIALSAGIDLDAAVAAKFNATSAKVGLPVTLRLTANV